MPEEAAAEAVEAQGLRSDDVVGTSSSSSAEDQEVSSCPAAPPMVNDGTSSSTGQLAPSIRTTLRQLPATAETTVPPWRAAPKTFARSRAENGGSEKAHTANRLHGPWDMQDLNASFKDGLRSYLRACAHEQIIWGPWW